MTDDPTNWLILQTTIRPSPRTMVDISLLRSPVFLILALNAFLTFCGFFVPCMFLNRVAIAKGHDKEASCFLVSIIGIVNIFSRIFCGFVADGQTCRKLHTVCTVYKNYSSSIFYFLSLLYSGGCPIGLSWMHC